MSMSILEQPSDDRSAEWRGGLNRPAMLPSDDRSAEGRGGLNRPARPQGAA
jgi:hypothetical protein